jgi:hypothetical protein
MDKTQGFVVKDSSNRLPILVSSSIYIYASRLLDLWRLSGLYQELMV